MIRVGRLSLTLPHGLKDRAGSISRHTGASLAAHRVNTDLRADSLAGLSIRAPRGATDAEIGRAIAAEILRRIGGDGGDGDA